MFREMLKNFLVGYRRGAIAQLEYEIRVKEAKIEFVEKMFPDYDKEENDFSERVRATADKLHALEDE